MRAVRGGLALARRALAVRARGVRAAVTIGGWADGAACASLSVNVGLPREVEWRGRTVRTAIFKAPVDGRRRVARLNVDGDGQADLVGHGGEHRAVYVYDRSAYDHWAGYLGRDDLAAGEFGENFTVEGMPDDAVCVGDRYRIGGALFEVTQPRVTCFKVGLRLGEPRMPSLMYSHGRPGFYMRVLEEGEVGAGDAIERVAAGPMSVREVSALLYLPGHSPAGAAAGAGDPGAARRAGAARSKPCSRATRGWRRRRRRRRGRGCATSASRRPRARASRSGRSCSSPSTASRFRASLPGQFLPLRLQPGLLRSYSLAAPADGRGYRIAVKREGVGQRVPARPRGRRRRDRGGRAARRLHARRRRGGAGRAARAPASA